MNRNFQAILLHILQGTGHFLSRAFQGEVCVCICQLKKAVTVPCDKNNFCSLQFIDDEFIKDFLWMDSCRKISDKVSLMLFLRKILKRPNRTLTACANEGPNLGINNQGTLHKTKHLNFFS